MIDLSAAESPLTQVYAIGQRGHETKKQAASSHPEVDGQAAGKTAHLSLGSAVKYKYLVEFRAVVPALNPKSIPERKAMTETGVIYTATSSPVITSPEPGMLRQVLAYNPHLMLVRHQFEKGWAGARHSHPHHQLVYVVRGHIRFMAEGQSWELRNGDSIVVNGSIEHEAAALENSEVLDVFTPYREDYAR